MVVAGENVDERKELDMLCEGLKRFVMEANIGIIAVSHIRRSYGQGHNEGKPIGIDDIRGTGGIAQMSNIVLAGERNKQAEDPGVATAIRWRALKNRYTGVEGPLGILKYDRDTGRTLQADEKLFFDPDTDNEGGPHRALGF